MNILVIGSGAREHAICYAVSQSSRLNELYAIPGNYGISQLAECHIIDINNFEVCKINDNDWTEILEVKKAVSKSLEEKRVDNIIGSSLEADVTIYCSNELYNILSELGKELKFIFITLFIVS